jgi:hypothetical protein
MSPMKIGWRAAISVSILGLMSALVGLAAWLGVSESPSVNGLLNNLLANTKAAGTVGFVMTTQTAGLHTVNRLQGEIDFADDSGTEVSVYTSPGVPAQWTQTLVVDGRAFQRPGTDVRGGRARFTAEWQRLSAGFAIPPFAPLAGPTEDPSPIPPDLVRVGRPTIDGMELTKYRVSAFSVSCPPSLDGPTTQTEVTWIWVDAEGRIRRWQNLDVAHFSGGTLRGTTTVTLGDFGTPVALSVPARVLEPTTATTTAKPIDPYAGCLVTPG